MLKWVVNKELKDANILFAILTPIVFLLLQELFSSSHEGFQLLFGKSHAGADIVIPRYVYSVTISRGWLL